MGIAVSNRENTNCVKPLLELALKIALTLFRWTSALVLIILKGGQLEHLRGFWYQCVSGSLLALMPMYTQICN